MDDRLQALPKIVARSSPIGKALKLMTMRHNPHAIGSGDSRTCFVLDPLLDFAELPKSARAEMTL